MENKRKEITKLFDENPEIESGSSFLSINSMKYKLGISFATNATFFHDLLAIVSAIAVPGIEIDKLYYEFDWEGPIRTLIFQTRSPMVIDDDKKNGIEYQYIYIDLIPDIRFRKNEEIYHYKILRKNFIINCINLIENNIDNYNNVFLSFYHEHNFKDDCRFKKEWLEAMKEMSLNRYINTY